MDFEAQLEDARVLAAFKHLHAFGEDQSPAMRDIAAVGESSTRLRFRTQIGPDGQRWQPSLRVQLHGGRTLTQAGHLSGSVSSGYGPDFAEWGENRVYAAIHQFGGVIRAKHGALRFRLANGAFVATRQVTMPARPSLGVSDDDAADILDVLEGHIASALDIVRSRIQGAGRAD